MTASDPPFPTTTLACRGRAISDAGATTVATTTAGGSVTTTAGLHAPATSALSYSHGHGHSAATDGGAPASVDQQLQSQFAASALLSLLSSTQRARPAPDAAAGGSDSVDMEGAMGGLADSLAPAPPAGGGGAAAAGGGAAGATTGGGGGTDLMVGESAGRQPVGRGSPLRTAGEAVGMATTADHQLQCVCGAPSFAGLPPVVMAMSVDHLVPEPLAVCQGTWRGVIAPCCCCFVSPHL